MLGSSNAQDGVVRGVMRSGQSAAAAKPVAQSRIASLWKRPSGAAGGGAASSTATATPNRSSTQTPVSQSQTVGATTLACGSPLASFSAPQKHEVTQQKPGSEAASSSPAPNIVTSTSSSAVLNQQLHSPPPPDSSSGESGPIPNVAHNRTRSSSSTHPVYSSNSGSFAFSSPPAVQAQILAHLQHQQQQPQSSEAVEPSSPMATARGAPSSAASNSPSPSVRVPAPKGGVKGGTSASAAGGEESPSTAASSASPSPRVTPSRRVGTSPSASSVARQPTASPASTPAPPAAAVAVASPRTAPERPAVVSRATSPGPSTRSTPPSQLRVPPQLASLMCDWALSKTDLVFTAFNAVRFVQLYPRGEPVPNTMKKLVTPDVDATLAEAATILSILKSSGSVSQQVLLKERQRDAFVVASAARKEVQASHKEHERLTAVNAELRAEISELRRQIEPLENSLLAAVSKAKALEREKRKADDRAAKAAQDNSAAHIKLVEMIQSTKLISAAHDEKAAALLKLQKRLDDELAAAEELREKLRSVGSEFDAFRRKVRLGAEGARLGQISVGHQTFQSGDVFTQHCVAELHRSEDRERVQVIESLEDLTRQGLQQMLRDVTTASSEEKRSQLHRELQAFHAAEVQTLLERVKVAESAAEDRAVVVLALKSQLDAAQNTLQRSKEQREQQQRTSSAVDGYAQTDERRVGCTLIEMAVQTVVVTEADDAASLKSMLADALRGVASLQVELLAERQKRDSQGQARQQPKSRPASAEVSALEALAAGADQGVDVATQTLPPPPMEFAATTVGPDGTAALCTLPIRSLEEKDHLIMTLQQDQEKLLTVIRMLKLQRDAKKPTVDKWTQLEGVFPPLRRDPVTVNRSASPIALDQQHQLQTVTPHPPSSRTSTATEELDNVTRNLLLLERALDLTDNPVLRDGVLAEMRETHRRFLTEAHASPHRYLDNFVME